MTSELSQNKKSASTPMRINHSRSRAVSALCLLLTLSAGCGKLPPKEYGMYIYNGRTPVPLNLGTYRSAQQGPNWYLNFVDSTACNPNTDAASDIAGVSDANQLEIVVYFQDLNAANVHMLRTEYDVFVKDVELVDDFPDALKRELFENRRVMLQHGLPSACVDCWLTPVAASDIGIFRFPGWAPKLRGGDASRGLFREANQRDNIIEMNVAPVKELPDAFVFTPKQALEPGVYMVIVRGDDAGLVTRGKGGALVRVGPRTAVRAAMDAGLKVANENLRRSELSYLLDSTAKTPQHN